MTKLETPARRRDVLRGVVGLAAAFGLVSVVSGCGDEKKDVAPPETTAKVPGGGDPNEYARQMQQNAQRNSGGAGGPGAGGPMGGPR